MSAEDYHDVPGFGRSEAGAFKPRLYTCNFCYSPISFTNKKPFNQDGTPHRCKARPKGPASVSKATDDPSVTLFAMSAMNAIISAQIQKFGGDFIHHMNFHDVADASWQAAAAMARAEKNYRDEFGEQP